MGLYCEGFGEVVLWLIIGYEDGNLIFWLIIEVVEYVCEKLVGEYWRYFDVLYIKVMVCVEVYRVLFKFDGGDLDCGIDDLFVCVLRVLVIWK